MRDSVRLMRNSREFNVLLRGMGTAARRGPSRSAPKQFCHVHRALRDQSHAQCTRMATSSIIYNSVVESAELPHPWKALLSLFAAVDAAISFLLKKHLACSLKNVVGVANSGRNLTNHLMLSVETLGLLAAASPPGLVFVRPVVAEGASATPPRGQGVQASSVHLSPTRDFAQFIHHHGVKSTPPRTEPSDSFSSSSQQAAEGAELSAEAFAGQLPSLEIELEPSGASKARRAKRARLFLQGCLQIVDRFHRSWLLGENTGDAAFDTIAQSCPAPRNASSQLAINRKVLLKWHASFPLHRVPLPAPVVFHELVPSEANVVLPYAALKPLHLSPHDCEARPMSDDLEGGFVRALDTAQAVREQRSRVAASGVGQLRGPAGSAAHPPAGGAAGCTFENVQSWLQQHVPAYVNQLVRTLETAAAASESADLQPPLPPPLHNALQRRGIARLYAHQVKGIQAARRREHVVVATSTSSGKSLIYNLPVIERLLGDPTAVALYMFPTKALAQDQLRALNELLDDATIGSQGGLLGGAIRPAVFDGDSTAAERKAALKKANIILCNPDILHVTLLPHHQRWSRLLRHLSVVVLDEAHVYSGVFGAHVALTLRRLRRVAMLYGARVQFIAASATIGNPDGLVRALIGESPFVSAARIAKDPVQLALGEADDHLTVINQDTSGAGRRKFIVWNPPLLSELLAARAADEATFMREMVQAAKATGDIHSALALAAAQLPASMSSSPPSHKVDSAGSPTETQDGSSSPSPPGDTGTSKSRKRTRAGSSVALSSASASASKRPRGRRRADALQRVRSLAREAAAALLPAQDSTPGDATNSSKQATDETSEGKMGWKSANTIGLRRRSGALSSFDSARITQAAVALLQSGKAQGAAPAPVQQQVQQTPTKSTVDPLGASTMAELRELWGAGGHASIAADLAPLPAVDLKTTVPTSSCSDQASGANSTHMQGAQLGVAVAPPPGWQEKWRARAERLYPPRRSAIVEGALVIAALVAGGMKTICFTRVRHVAELLLQYVHERLARIAPWAVPLVKSYRGGYLKEHRRQIEQAMFQGRLSGIVATNALELGIDIGALDAVVLVGYPGSIASLWQQSGRAGRGRKDAVSVLVTFDSPTDQFYARHPEELATRAPEEVHVDLSNVNILRQQLVCAAGEVPLSPADIGVFGPQMGPVLKDLKAAELLVPAPSHWRQLLSSEYPQDDVHVASGKTDASDLITLDDLPVAAAGAGGGLVDSRVRSDFVAGRRTWAASSVAASGSTATAESKGPISHKQHQVVRCLPPGAVPVHIAASAPSHKRLFRGLLHARGAGYLLLNKADERGVISSVDIPHPGASAGRGIPPRAVGGGAPALVHRAWALAPWVDQPAKNVSMRAIDDVHYDIVDVGAGGALVDTVEEWRAYFSIHPGAIYMQQGVTYKVEHLDTSKHVARVRVANVPYYTATRDHTDLTVLGRLADKLGRRAFYGRLGLSQETFGYKKVWKHGGGVFEVVDLTLPAVSYQTFGFWLDIPLQVKHQLDERGLDLLAGMHAANHAIVAVLPMFVKSERTDLGCECPNAQQQRAKPMRLLIYDKRPGGTGISAAAFSRLEDMVTAAISLCMDCPCDHGCPSCVHDLACSQYNYVIDKAAGVLLLQDALCAMRSAY